jgi:release factor glutamine methyltransferase
MMLDAAIQTVAGARKTLADKFARAGIESPDTDARLLIADALDLDRAGLTACSARALTAQESHAVEILAARRLKHEPVARILGRKEFWSLSFTIGPAVLVPRPETETVIEAALDIVTASNMRGKKLRILDIGTGSGALLLALLSELPNAVGTGTDISAEALTIARDNANDLGLKDRCTFIAADGTANLSGPFDFILSNPPYIAHGDIASLAPEVRDYDPTVALDGGADGLDGYRMVAESARLRAPGGHLIVELGYGQEASVRALFANAALMPGRAHKDLAGIARALVSTGALQQGNIAPSQNPQG